MLKKNSSYLAIVATAMNRLGVSEPVAGWWTRRVTWPAADSVIVFVVRGTAKGTRSWGRCTQKQKRILPSLRETLSFLFRFFFVTFESVASCEHRFSQSLSISNNARFLLALSSSRGRAEVRATTIFRLCSISSEQRIENIYAEQAGAVDRNSDKGVADAPFSSPSPGLDLLLHLHSRSRSILLVFSLLIHTSSSPPRPLTRLLRPHPLRLPNRGRSPRVCLALRRDGRRRRLRCGLGLFSDRREAEPGPLEVR